MNTLFIRNPIVGLRLLLAVILSIVLMTLDHQHRVLEPVRKVLTVAVLPLQFLVDTPVRMVNWLDLSITTHQSLLSENAELRGQLLLLKSQVQKFEALEQENTQLRELLQSSTRVEGKVEVVQLLSVSADPFVHQIVLDKGSNHGVYVGQPVLDANGIMGQVIRVTPFTSEVLLITDTRSAIPVQDSRNNLRAIATGSGSYGTLQ
ncbi:MAG: rod shape-determining protein MreC, partial [Proteobacteria bacterium]|nr:rod shape-determining protein MreC [Pseudomonadota bacterium]